MSANKEPVPIGAVVIDCSGIAHYLEDKAPGELVGKHPTRPGYDKAFHEIISNQEEVGVDVGITANDIHTLVQANQRIDEIDAILPAALRLVERLQETRHCYDWTRHRKVSEIARLVDARSAARDSKELLAQYKETRDYRSEVALRAAGTRRRNQNAAVDAADQDADSSSDTE